MNNTVNQLNLINIHKTMQQQGQYVHRFQMYVEHLPKLTRCRAIKQVSVNSREFELFIVMSFDYSGSKLENIF